MNCRIPVLPNLGIYREIQNLAFQLLHPFVDAQMELTDVAGNPFTMPTGRTWVELIPIETTGEYAFDGVVVPMKNPPLPAATPEPSDTATP